ncbi:hypothetical protein FBU30_007198 [Linnemannia zychae]|nr:hypothetical protein FBU30_007198 [Linnemannia zychae]
MTPFYTPIYPLTITIFFCSQSVLSLDPLGRPNAIDYWGQNSVSYTDDKETDLIAYCQDGTVIIFAQAFISQVQKGRPLLNLANHYHQAFLGSSPPLLNCPKLVKTSKPVNHNCNHT